MACPGDPPGPIGEVAKLDDGGKMTKQGDAGAGQPDPQPGEPGPDIQGAILFLPRTQSGRDRVILRDVLPIAMELDWKWQRRAWRRLMGTV